MAVDANSAVSRVDSPQFIASHIFIRSPLRAAFDFGALEQATAHTALHHGCCSNSYVVS